MTALEQTQVAVLRFVEKYNHPTRSTHGLSSKSLRRRAILALLASGELVRVRPGGPWEVTEKGRARLAAAGRAA